MAYKWEEVMVNVPDDFDEIEDWWMNKGETYSSLREVMKHAAVEYVYNVTATYRAHREANPLP